MFVLHSIWCVFDALLDPPLAHSRRRHRTLVLARLRFILYLYGCKIRVNVSHHHSKHAVVPTFTPRACMKWTVDTSGDVMSLFVRQETLLQSC
jgi:hypothetical protein